MQLAVDTLADDIAELPRYQHYGRVTAIQGMLVEVGGAERALTIGARCLVRSRTGRGVPCEVVGFRDQRALLLPFDSVEGVGLGCKAEVGAEAPSIRPSEAWLGRVVNALGLPVDGAGDLPLGRKSYRLRASPPPAHSRRPIGGKIDLGVRAINTFLTTCRGQRMGIFAGSGVGKSILLSMLARMTRSDVAVIGLVGERGREVQEFIRHNLGPDGLARTVVVVATSDESPLMRRQAAYTTLAVAEYFRDLGKDVLCVIDSITRFAMAQREIGLSAGEPPTTKGYPPSVFAELPKLAERAGPGPGEGTITALFSVLVEGDDHNEPIADALRGTLDGHIVLDRAIAERGRFPAVNVLRSVSRMMPACNSDDENELVQTARRHLARYEDMAEMVRLGAYREGTDPEVDAAIALYPALEAFMAQKPFETGALDEGYADLARILSAEAGA